MFMNKYHGGLSYQHKVDVTSPVRMLKFVHYLLLAEISMLSLTVGSQYIRCFSF